MSFDFEKRIAQYVTLRNKIKDADEAHKKATAPMREMLEKLNGAIREAIQASKQESAKASSGTAYLKHKVSATIADPAAFKRHVIGTESWDLADWKANGPAVKAFVEEHHTVPPGINYSVTVDVGVRTASSTKV